MTIHELQDRLTAINDKTGKNARAATMFANCEPGHPILVSSADYAVFENAYIALDLNKDTFAKFVFADGQEILNNAEKWEWMIRAHDHYRAECQYECDLRRIEDLQRELGLVKQRKEDYEKRRRTYAIVPESDCVSAEE